MSWAEPVKNPGVVGSGEPPLDPLDFPKPHPIYNATKAFAHCPTFQPCP